MYRESGKDIGEWAQEYQILAHMLMGRQPLLLCNPYHLKVECDERSHDDENEEDVYFSDYFKCENEYDLWKYYNSQDVSFFRKAYKESKKK